MQTAIRHFPGRVTLFRMKSDQFRELPDSEQVRLELLDGEVVMAARPSADHQRFAFKLAKALDDWVEEHDLGIVLPETQVELDENWMPVPDILFLERQHTSRVRRQMVVGPVDLAVEVLSPSDEHADRQSKFEAYAHFGVTWYWIVDLHERQIEEYKLVGKSYRKPVIVPFDEPFEPRLFKGLVLDLSKFVLRRRG